MNADEKVGQRLAELRRRSGQRQEDFLKLLESRGVSWTQTVLSRVESGKRPIRLTEGFAVADALGVAPEELSPIRSELDYKIEALRLKLRETQQGIARANHQMRRLTGAIYALLLVGELRQDPTAEFFVHGTAERFVDTVGLSMSGNLENGYNHDDVFAFLGIEDDEVDPDSFGVSDDDEALGAEWTDHLDRLVRRHFPGLTFDDSDGPLTVKGMETPTEPHRLASDPAPGEFVADLMFGNGG